MTRVEEMRMLEKLEELRRESLNGNTVYALSDGYQILGADTSYHVEFLKSIGYWVCSIFENGYRVEA